MPTIAKPKTVEELETILAEVRANGRKLELISSPDGKRHGLAGEYPFSAFVGWFDSKEAILDSKWFPEVMQRINTFLKK